MDILKELDSLDGLPTQRPKVHIRIQMRSGRKCITTITGIVATNYKLNDLVRTLKRAFNTNGTLLHDEEFGTIIQMQGDVRAKVKDFLLTNLDYEDDDILTYGA